MALPNDGDFMEVKAEIERWDLPLLTEVFAVLEAWLTFGNTWDEVFEAYMEAKAALRDFEALLVRRCRIDGETWDEIADYLGLSRAGAQKRHQRLGIEELDALDELHTAQSRAFSAELKLQMVRSGSQSAGVDQEEAFRRATELFAQQGRERSALRKRLDSEAG